jgi:hypothetical protein
LIGDLGHGGAHQKLDLGIAGKQIKVLCVAARDAVHVDVVAKNGSGRYGVLLVVFSKLYEQTIRFCIDDCALFYPALRKRWA